MTFALEFTNAHKERFYFVSDTEAAPHRKDQRRISETTPHINKAKQFASEPEAISAWALCGRPTGWKVIPYEPA